MPVTSFTRRELIDQVLANLKVLAEGQTPSAEEVEKVDKMIDPTIALLAARDIYYVPDAGERGPVDGAIDPAIFLPLADCVAFAVSGSFNQAGDAALAALNSVAEELLKDVGRPASTMQTLRVDRGLQLRRTRGERLF